MQELCLADAALSRVDTLDPDTAAHLADRATWWRAIYDEDVGFFHARNSDGSFEDFDSESWWLDEYSEGNARQYLWMVPHDPEGLFEVLGGKDVAIARLEELFDETAADDTEWQSGLPGRWYWHGNEIDIHVPWLFALAGRPDLTRQWVAWVMAERYSTEATGLAGNDDGGTLSAWYVWAAMGLYPLAGTDRYVLGDPVFTRVEIQMPDGVFTIERLGTDELAEIRLDGQVLTQPDLHHEQLVVGSTLSFVGADAR